MTARAGATSGAGTGREGRRPPPADDVKDAHDGRGFVEVDDACDPRPHAPLVRTLTLYLKLKDTVVPALCAEGAAGRRGRQLSGQGVVDQLLLPLAPAPRVAHVDGRARRCRPDPRRARGLRAARPPGPPGPPGPPIWVVRIGRTRNRPRDHPLPSGCAFSLRIDERREGGHGAPHAPGQPPWKPAPWEPPRRGSPVREDKKSRRILIFPPATEPADGRTRPDS